MNRTSALLIVLFNLSFLGAAVLFVTGGQAKSSLALEPAQQEVTVDEGCPDLDMIFLVDQSGSMNGFKSEEGKVPATDPTKQRAYAPQSMIGLLATMKRDRCPNSVRRISVISFGTDKVDESEVRIDLPLTTVAFTNTVALAKQITATTLGWTDPQVAFKVAYEEFGRNPISSRSDQKRAVILITDGQPCIPNAWCETGVDVPREEVLAYAEEMKRQIGNDFPHDEFYIWISTLAIITLTTQ